MNLKQLKIFIAVAECGSITKASEILFMAQPAVSVALKELEEEYHIKLFERIKQRLKITEIGSLLLQNAYRIVAETDLFEEFAKKEATLKKVNIAASLSTGEKLVPRLFTDLEKDCNYLMKYRVTTSDLVIKDVLSAKADIGIIEDECHDTSLDIIPFMDDHLLFVCHQDYYNKSSISLEELCTHPLLLRNTNTGTRKAFDRIIFANNLKYHAKCVSDNNTALLQFAKYQYGIAVVPMSVCDNLDKDLKVIKIANYTFDRKLSIITRKNCFEYIKDLTKIILDRL